MDQGSGQRHESDGGGVRQEGAQGEAQERGALQRVPECGGQRQVQTTIHLNIDSDCITMTFTQVLWHE